MRKFFFMMFMCFCLAAKAQIGYQVALLNSATGEPRANVTVNVDVKLTGADGSVIVNQTRNATTNDLGLLSLTIGDSMTFENVDWKRALPLSVSVTADGVLVASSEVLTVPVAEYAKSAGDVLTDEMLVGTWEYKDSDGNIRITFNKDGSGVRKYEDPWYEGTDNFLWDRDGAWIMLQDLGEHGKGGYNILRFSTKLSSLIVVYGGYAYKKIN